MTGKRKSSRQRQKVPNTSFVTGQKLKTKMVLSKAFLSLPVRKSPEISVTCLTRRTGAEHGLKFNVRSSLKLKEKRRSAPQHNREPSVSTPDAEPYVFCDKENKAGPLASTPEGRKEKGTSELKQNVLRTISRMLQENRSIREQRGLGSQNCELLQHKNH
ncbi:uncharacterized protein Hap1MRO34_025007 isoform 3-T3 [Clarias gariepinus]